MVTVHIYIYNYIFFVMTFPEGQITETALK